MDELLHGKGFGITTFIRHYSFFSLNVDYAPANSHNMFIAMALKPIALVNPTSKLPLSQIPPRIHNAVNSANDQLIINLS